VKRDKRLAANVRNLLVSSRNLDAYLQSSPFTNESCRTFEESQRSIPATRDATDPPSAPGPPTSPPSDLLECLTLEQRDSITRIWHTLPPHLYPASHIQFSRARKDSFSHCIMRTRLSVLSNYMFDASELRLSTAIAFGVRSRPFSAR